MSFGQVGYTDGQRGILADPQEPVLAHQAAVTGQYVSPIWSVSNWHNVLLIHNPNVVTNWLFHSWADQAGTIPLRQAGSVYDPAQGNPFVSNVPALGPFMSFEVNPQGGAGTNWTDNTYVYQNNRPTGTPIVGIGGPDGPVQGPLAAGASITSQGSFTGSGPFGIFVNGGNQGVNMQLNIMGTAFAYYSVSNWSVAAGATDYRTIMLPIRPRQLIMTNASGAAQCTGCLMVWWTSATNSA